MRFISILILILNIAIVTQGARINRDLYINRGNFKTVNNTFFPCLAFNDSLSFTPVNSVIRLKTGDTLYLSIFNNDSISHGFNVGNINFPTINIAPGQKFNDTLIFSTEGIYIFYDPSGSDKFRYLGLGSMITVDNSVSKFYFWNLKEHQTSYNNLASTGNELDFSKYDPDYFTINGLSFPDLQNDSTARVEGLVGDTIRIFMANTGQSGHSIHFHGFHCKILFSNKDPNFVGRSKDTFPIRSMESMVLELIPDKPGEYSVHDHNLVAVSGGGIHPNGMFLIMKIQ